MNPIITQVASALFWTVYGSFFEWWWHKLWMHTPRFPREAFRGHTIVHHGLYRGDDSYFVEEGTHPEHILLKPYALPAICLGHLPVVLVIEHFVPHTAIGAISAMLLYFVTYEYMHWNMHVPRGHFVERFRWFQFLRNHHKLHHRYYQKNFCVLLPLADLCLGTLITEQSLAARKAQREELIASGGVTSKKVARKRQKQSKDRVKLSRFASMKLARIGRTSGGRSGWIGRKAGRKRLTRQNAPMREFRAVINLVKGRKER
ncbi:MAG TPA: sterol desaturase family protein [Chthonomonadales bacterium]|nr:sterol desaturase family protein [Chthonomonadales bacterium]